MSTLTTSYQLLGSKYVGTSGGSLYIRVYAKYSEQDITNNKTKVQYQARAYYENSTYIYDQSGNGSVSGTSASTVSGSCTRPTTGETTIATTEGWVSHNSDGTMSITASATLNFPNWGWSATASGDATLPTIPRATSCPNLDGYIESSAPISINPASSSFKHRLYYSYNGKTGYYPSSTEFFVNTGSLTLDTSFYSYTPKSSGTGSLTLYTYDSSGNEIGSKTGTITVRCDKEKCKPTITAEVVDINETTKALTGDSTKLIKGYSNAQITYTINVKNSSTLKNKTVNGSTLGTSPHTIYGVSTEIFSIVAIDSRDFDTTEIKTSAMVDYIPLTLDFTAYRPTPTGSEIKINFQGNYFDNSFGSVSNDLSLSWKYRIKGASDWNDGGVFSKDTDYTVSDNRFSSIGDISLSDSLFDYQNNYEIGIFYEDKLINNSVSKIVTKGEPVLSWEDGLVNVNGSLTKNNQEVAIAESEQSSSTINAYSCDYVNNKTKVARVSSTVNTPISADTYTKIPFDYILKMDNGLELTPDGGIKITGDVKVANVSARIRIGNEATIVAAIRKNDETTNLAVNCITVGQYQHITISTSVDVLKNDVIYCYVHSNIANETIGGGEPPIWIAMDVLTM